MAVKRTPWLVLPFVLAGIALESEPGGRRELLRTSARYLALALGAFLIPNAPFIILSPHTWLSGIMTPLLGQTVPAGQGLVGVACLLGLQVADLCWLLRTGVGADSRHPMRRLCRDVPASPNP